MATVLERVKTFVEEKILSVLLENRGEPIHIDKIIELSKFAPHEVSSSLTMMELEDKVKNAGGGYYLING